MYIQAALTRSGLSVRVLHLSIDAFRAENLTGFSISAGVIIFQNKSHNVGITLPNFLVVFVL